MTLDRDGPDAPGLTLLVIDGRLAERLGELLRGEGRHVASAGTPEEALVMMNDQAVECVLLERPATEFSAAVLEQRTLIGRELDALAYAVSHDLRAPLRSVEGFSAALVEHAADALDPKAKDYLGRIRAGALRMADMIDGLLELSRISRVAITREQADLSAIAGRVAAALAEAEPTRQVAVGIQPGLVAKADRALMTKLFEQLIGNSWKFTAKVEQPAVDIGAIRTAGSTAYFVRDNGDGFDPAYARNLFRPFQRFHRAADYPGRGLGLALVARIVERHGGSVRALSVPGVGTTIDFTLPAPRPGGRA